MIAPFFCGLFAGLLSSWGVGGGTLLLLLMTLFLGVPDETARGINLLFFLPTASVALFFHRKNGFLSKKTVRLAVPWGVALAIVGAVLSTAVEVALLRKPFGIFLLLCAAALLRSELRPPPPHCP